MPGRGFIFTMQDLQKRYKSLYKAFKFLSRKKKAAPEPRRSPCFEFNFF